MGFSLTGLIIIIVTLFPNLLFIKYPPKNAPLNLSDASPVLTVIENIGRYAFFIILIFSKSNYQNAKINLWLIFIIITILCYYCLWIKYVIKGKYFYLLFEPLWFIPIPMAVFPILTFGFTALWGKSIYLGFAVLIFGIGHLINSWNSYIITKNT